MIEASIGRVVAGEDLSMDEMSAAVEAIMHGLCGDGEIASLLTALRIKGETVEEVAGAATAMRKNMCRISTSRTGLIDTCGTGGDGSRTFNISTAAALVTAAAGAPVAKHGNRSITSSSGSADVLASLGVNVNADVACVTECIDELGIGFCFAPLLHPSMKRVAAVRKALGVPTVFNLLGPLSNPAGAPYQVLGVGRPELRPLLANALALLGATRAVVVCGEDGLDEVTMSGRTMASEVTAAGVREFEWTPQDFGLQTSSRDALLVDGPDSSANVIRRVFSGEPGPPRDIVVANAAAALWTAGKSGNTQECARIAADAIDSGATVRLLEALVERTNRQS